MNDVKKPEKVQTALGPGSSAIQASSEATRRLWEQGQTFVDALAEWNSEVAQFVGHRISRNGDTFARLSKCQGFTDAFAIQTHWIQEATDDYSKEIQKLTEINGRITTHLSGSGSHLQARSATTRSLLKAAE